MKLRSTHTYVELELSPAAYDEIAAKLRAANYDHAFMDVVWVARVISFMAQLPQVAPVLGFRGQLGGWDMRTGAPPRTGA